MAGNTINTVKLKGDGWHKEYMASAAITPGYLCELFNSSGVLKVRKHATAGGRARRLIALENSLVGKDLTQAYAASENVILEEMSGGVEVNMLVAASATAITIGDLLESAGDGTVRKRTTNPATITDSTGGTPSATFAAIAAGGSYAQADLTAIKNALSEVAVLFNAQGGISGGVIGQALESCDNSGGSAEVRIQVAIF